MALEKLPDGRYAVLLVAGVATEVSPIQQGSMVIPLVQLPAIISDKAVVGGDLFQQIAEVVRRRCG